MDFIKTFFANKLSRVWFIVTVAVVIVLIAANIVVSIYSGVINLALGGERAVEVEDSEAQVYYEKETESKDEATQKGFELTQLISEEGTIMLKNNGALPMTGDGLKVSVFGKNSVNLVYGGSGSGGGDTTFEKKDIFESLTAAGFDYNERLRSFYENNSESGSTRDESPALSAGNDAQEPMSTGETPIENYIQHDIPDTYAEYSDAAIVVLSRIAGESYDLPKARSEERDQKHYLALDKYERDLIDHVTENFEKVIVVLNTLNTIEAGELEDNDKVDSVLWIGGPGSTGIMALGRILNGSVTPSGHTVDTWARDFTKDPTWNNFSEAVDADGNYISNSGRYSTATRLTDYSFVRYEEDIYVGYRYYETKAQEERMASGNNSWYEENVVYPFGHGLSYTDFEWEVTDKSSIENVNVTADGKYTVDVEVTNTGAYKGKDVVQLYVKLHYNEGGLEKSHVVLCDFAKTPMLYPTADKAAIAEDSADGDSRPNSVVMTLTFDPYDVASYDHLGRNASGFKGWIMEAGDDYELYVNRNSNPENADNIRIPFEVSEDITYAEDPDTGAAVKNRYTDCEDSDFNSDTAVKDTLMSRTDFTLPDVTTQDDRFASDELIDALEDLSHNNPVAESYTDMPTQGLAPTVKFVDLVRYDDKSESWIADYDEENDDPTWQALLDSLTINEMSGLINMGGFSTGRIDSIGKPATLESDGPVGWCNFIAKDDTWKGNVVYTSQVVVSSSWNVDLAREMGESVGEEALWGATKTDGRTYSGWYSPGINLHRSQFCGRNFEYYSEDSYLTGKMAAALVRGCRSKGVYTYVKHFAVNEQETNRTGLTTWLTEQALRELYLKPFEIAVKEGGTTTMMSSFNRIGTRWTGGDYRLLTEILRNEWGFRGTVICDYNTGATCMNVKQMVYAGGDLNLATDSISSWSPDRSSVADVTVLRQATKNVLYTVANSNAINNLNYKYLPAIWRIVFTVANIVIAVGLAVWGVFAVLSAVKAYKQKTTNNGNDPS